MTEKELEDLFGNFIEKFGGEKIVPPDNLPGKYADYVFHNESPAIVAELKCLMKDSSRNSQQKLSRAYASWVQAGLMPESEEKEIHVSSDMLPHGCNEEVFRIIKPPVEGVLKKANKQIGNIRNYLNLPSAQGLVFIINEGRNALSPLTLTGIVAWILERQAKENIDCVIVLTVSLTVTDPVRGPGGRIWAPIFREGHPHIPEDFLKGLEIAWVEYLQEQLGAKIRHYQDETPEFMKSMSYELGSVEEQLPFCDIQQSVSVIIERGNYYWQPQTGIAYYCEDANEYSLIMTTFFLQSDRQIGVTRYEIPKSKSYCFVAVTNPEQLASLTKMYEYLLLQGIISPYQANHVHHDL